MTFALYWACAGITYLMLAVLSGQLDTEIQRARNRPPALVALFGVLLFVWVALFGPIMMVWGVVEVVRERRKRRGS